jgi:nucleoside-diphosphate-sugar epimerase
VTVIVGGGLIARAFEPLRHRLPAACVFASGVSNSTSTDAAPFERERKLLDETLARHAGAASFVYFSTCSVDDPASRDSAYVAHKLGMEERVRRHEGHLIVRLPQLAGNTANPHTLLNYLRDRIVRHEHFSVWGGARRNIIDVEDAARIVTDLLLVERVRGETVVVANALDVAVLEVVAVLEEVLGEKGDYTVIQRGEGYAIDTRHLAAVIRRNGIRFDEGYLRAVVSKYYARP